MTPCKSRSVLALFVLAFVPSACGSPGAAGTRESPAVEHVSDAGSDAMGVVFVPRIGAVLSADIAVPDHEREVRFYSRVLGTGDDPLWREDLLNNMGMPIIGLGAAVPEYAHLPLHWMPHIQVADVAASAQRAVDLGGSVLMQAEEGEAGGPWAVLLDPNQAAFGIIPVLPPEAMAQHGGAPSPDAATPVGRIGWLDLTVPDGSAARDFYRRVVGWSVEDVEMRDGDARYADYAMLAEDGTALAGICHERGVNAGLPPVWLIYLPVGDLAESLRRVEEEGGEVVKTVHGVDGSARYAVIQDPVGVHFALMQG